MWRRVLSSAWLSVTLLVLLLLSLSLQFWGLTLVGTRVDHDSAGSWGELVSGVASAVAVIVAVGTFASGQRRLEQEREAVRVAELTRVYCWLEPRLDHGSRRVWVLHFENHTSMPIFSWRVVIESEPAVVLSGEKQGPVRPGATDLRVQALEGRGEETQPSLAFEFHDANGGKWRRSAHGIEKCERQAGE
ncbi:hypothetical protein AB0395_24860 [Streptosporangium sp. NPDC051023]|uniref:hypothetical protein n=1 Tax=Streptosporangium sp. NPDC051023 TaxID=3155410 RepID=UPI00344BF524